ncbi:hypothetical protein TNCV_277681, partial [Trichonephila clavipes]
NRKLDEAGDSEKKRFCPESRREGGKNNRYQSNAPDQKVEEERNGTKNK